MMNVNLSFPWDENATDQNYTDRMRLQRDGLLAASDWSQLPDAPCDHAAWATYRQALRDFPASWVPGPVAEFPDPPVS